MCFCLHKTCSIIVKNFITHVNRNCDRIHVHNVDNKRIKQIWVSAIIIKIEYLKRQWVNYSQRTNHAFFLLPEVHYYSPVKVNYHSALSSLSYSLPNKLNGSMTNSREDNNIKYGKPNFIQEMF